MNNREKLKKIMNKFNKYNFIIYNYLEKGVLLQNHNKILEKRFRILYYNLPMVRNINNRRLSLFGKRSSTKYCSFNTHYITNYEYE